MRKHCYIFKGLVLPMLVLALAVSCQQSRIKRVRVKPGAVNVGVSIVSQGVEISQRSYVGTLEPSVEAIVSTVHGGTLESLHIGEGESVKGGQLLAKVKSPTLENSYKATKAALDQAKDGYQRIIQVYAEGAVTPLKMVEVNTKLKQAEAAMSTAISAMDECKVRAPFDGKVAEIMIHTGEHVNPGQPLFSIIDADDLEVAISVPEKELGNVTLSSGAKVYFPSLGGNSYAACVKAKSLVANNLSHTYKCTLKLLDRPAGLMSGMVCKVYLNSDYVKGISVPADIIQIGSRERYVWLVENGTVVKRIVTVGGYCGKGVIVTSGLEPGDMLIVSGSDKVSVGMNVEAKITD